MDREELFAAVVAARPGPDDVLYLGRRGTNYSWWLTAGELTASDPADAPEVWMYFSGDWPFGDPTRLRSFFDDLLAELESMAGGADRCRWPLDQPWPLGH